MFEQKPKRAKGGRKMTKEEILKDIRAIDDKDNPLLRCDNDGKAMLYIVEKTAERTKREMIEKAVGWLKEEMHYKDHSSGRGSWGEIVALGVYDSLEEFIEDFKQAMQDESK